MEIDDALIGQNVARARGKMPQKELAVAMRERGHKWSQATVWNVERGERPLRLSEASALTEILHAPGIGALTVTGAQHEVFSALTLVTDAQNRLDIHGEAVLRQQRHLAEEADKLAASDPAALEAGDLGRDIAYALGLMPVELLRDLQGNLLASLRARGGANGPYTQTLITGLEAIQFVVED